MSAANAIHAPKDTLRPYIAALSSVRNTASAIAAHVDPVDCGWREDPNARRCETCGAQWIRLRPTGCHVAAGLMSAIHALTAAHKRRLVSRQWDEAHAHFRWTRTPAGDAWLAGRTGQ